MIRNLTACIKASALCIFLLVECSAQVTGTDTLCVADATISLADSSDPSLPVGVRSTIRAYVDFKVSDPNGEYVSVVLSNVKGKEILSRDFSVLTPNNYVLSFLDVRCSGVYFVRLTVGDRKFTRSVSLQETVPASPAHQDMDLTGGTEVVDGVWEKSYNQIIFPAISPPEDRPVPDTVVHQVILELRQHTYAISWTSHNKDQTIQADTYRGAFLLLGDTIKFLDPRTNAVTKFYQFQVYSDTLTLAFFQKTQDGYLVAPIQNPIAPSLALEGTYRRRNRE